MQPVAIEVIFDESYFTVRLNNGSSLRVPFEWFPKLQAATPDQRQDVRISASGYGLHWDKLDEDISVAGLLKGHRSLARDL